MSLNFIGEVGIYFPTKDAVKITAIDGDRVVDCYATRSALQAIGCGNLADPWEILATFEKQRVTVEVAAMIKYRRGRFTAIQVHIEAADLDELLPAAELERLSA
jgi:hypothetical protein